MDKQQNLKFKQNLYGACECMFTVISALFLRETVTLYGQNKMGYVWVLLRDIFGIGIFIAIRLLIGIQFEKGMHIVFFLLAGFLIFYIFSESVSKCMNAISANSALLSFPHVIPLDLMITRCIMVFFTNMQSALFVVIATFLCGISLTIGNVGLFVYCILGTSLLGFAFGVLLSSLSVFYPFLGKLWTFASRILFFASGVFFSVDRFPSDYREILSYNPILQLIEGFRSSMSDLLIFEDVLNVNYINFLILTFLSLGLLIEKSSHKRLEQ